jgi:hypothetical protein
MISDERWCKIFKRIFGIESSIDHVPSRVTTACRYHVPILVIECIRNTRRQSWRGGYRSLLQKFSQYEKARERIRDRIREREFEKESLREFEREGTWYISSAFLYLLCRTIYFLVFRISPRYFRIDPGHLPRFDTITLSSPMSTFFTTSYIRIYTATSNNRCISTRSRLRSSSSLRSQRKPLSFFFVWQSFPSLVSCCFFIYTIPQ